MDERKYDELIEKIERKRNRVNTITIIVGLLILFFAGPTRVEVMEKPIIAYEGLPHVLIAVLFILCLFSGLVAYALVSSPLTTSMENECDPEKHLILNKNLNKQRNIDHIYAVDYLYLGNYPEAVKYAEKMIATTNGQKVLAGLFNRARCEFFLEDYDAFRETVRQYESTLANCKKLNVKTKEGYQKINVTLSLMCAISKDDAEKINELRNNIETWNTLKATEGFVNYIKGVAAYKIEDKEEAIYRFKSVKEHCSKTVLAELSDKYLLLFK